MTSVEAPTEQTKPLGQCLVCDNADLEVFLEAAEVPAHVGVLWRTDLKARSCARGRLRMVFCRRCGHIANDAFDSSLLDYSLQYDNALHASGVFRVFEHEVATGLVERRRVRNKDVLEVGCGDGHFLRLVCKLGNNRGMGYEPSISSDSIRSDDGAVVIRHDYFTADSFDGRADLVCCRQVLEHMAAPRMLLSEVRAVLDRNPQALAYFDVPNVDLILTKLSIWDLIYEHCQYFSDASLRYVFEREGFHVDRLWPSFSSQFLSIEATAGKPGSHVSDPPTRRLNELARRVAVFGKSYNAKLAAWRATLDQRRENGERIVVWSAGAKGLSFVNLLAAHDTVDFIVDINPGKQGTFMAGTGHEISHPARLADEPPDTVIVVNPIYTQEIRAELDRLGLEPEILTA